MSLVVTASPAFASDLNTQGIDVNTGAHAARLTVGACTTGDAVLPDGTLTDDPGVEPCGKLTANNVDIAPGSAVHFRAGSSIALGEGFSVGAGAAFTAELGATTTGNAFVRDESPSAVTDFYARFYIDPGNLVLDDDGDTFDHLVAYDAAGNKEFLIGVTYESGVAQKRLFMTGFSDNGTAFTTKDVCEPVLGPGWQFVEAHWTASTGSDGDVELRVNGGAPQLLSQCLALATGLDNDTGEISAVEWGALNASAGYLGSMGMDDFDARAGTILTSAPERLQPANPVHNNQAIGFGSAVALAANVLVVGSPGEDTAGLTPLFDSGAVRVFERQGGSWVETQQLRAPVETAQERFGHSVDIAMGDSGIDFLIVGARGFNGARGRAYLFKRENGGQWLHEQTVTQDEPEGGDAFGESVTIDFFQPPNDPNATGPVFVAAVGAPFNRTTGSSQNGSVSIFQQSGGASAWTRTHEFFGPFNTNLGSSVAMAGPEIIAAADGLANPGKNVGGALRFTQANLVVTAYNYVTAGELLPSDYMPGAFTGKGLVVALDKDPPVPTPVTAALGANRHDDGALNTGKVYVFDVAAGVIAAEVATLQAPGTPANAAFGTSVALSGPLLAVGAPGVGSDGTVFLYEKGATNASWTVAGTLAIPDVPPAGGCFGGYDVAVNGSLVAAGCWTNSGGYENEGAFLFFGDAIFSDGFESGDTSAWTSSTP